MKLKEQVGPLKPRWWCITKECKHYEKFNCFHPSIEKVLQCRKIRIKNLRMCPVFADTAGCLRLK